MSNCVRCGLKIGEETNSMVAWLDGPICGNCEFGNMSLDKETLNKCKQYHLKKE